MKLTPQQNMVINCLQNGWVFITDGEMKGAWVANDDYQFYIGTKLFWNLHEKGLTDQQISYPFHWVLTKEGKSIKTKDIQQDILNTLNK